MKIFWFIEGKMASVKIFCLIRFIEAILASKKIFIFHVRFHRVDRSLILSYVQKIFIEASVARMNQKIFIEAILAKIMPYNSIFFKNIYVGGNNWVVQRECLKILPFGPYFKIISVRCQHNFSNSTNNLIFLQHDEKEKIFPKLTSFYVQPFFLLLLRLLLWFLLPLLFFELWW